GRSYSTTRLTFNATSRTTPYTLSLHDALPICSVSALLRLMRAKTVAEGIAAGEDYVAPAVNMVLADREGIALQTFGKLPRRDARDRKSTRLNSSHVKISYAVYCLKKKKTDNTA